MPCDSYYMQDMAVVAELMSNAKGLKELTIESPSVNASNFEEEEVWKPMTDSLFRPFQASLTAGEPSIQPLQKLTKCKQ